MNHDISLLSRSHPVLRFGLGVLLKAAWLDGQGCVITHTDNKVLAATFIYSMCFDLTVHMLAAYKLGVAYTPRRDRSRIVRLIFDDGLIFFIVA